MTVILPLQRFTSRWIFGFCQLKKLTRNVRYPNKELAPFESRLRLVSAFLGSAFTLSYSILNVKAEAEAETGAALPIQKELILADSLYDNGKYKEAYDLLSKYKDTNNADILWRLGRLCYELARPLKSDSEQKPFHLEGYEYVKKALECDETNFAAHKWMFILLDKAAYHEGMKQRIEKAYVTKAHIQRACELNPKDGTSWHLLAFWCYAVAEMPWYQRQIASALFAAPPTSSYEEALKYFLEAENAEPNFYSTNLLMLGKCYVKLGNKEEAIKYLLRARDYEQKTFEDKQTHAEAVQLLKSLGK